MTRSAHTVKWMAATAGLCLAGLVGAWLLLLGPMLDAAAATRDQAAQVRAQNAALTGRLTALATEFEGIEDYRAELAALRLQLPDDADLTALGREIDAAADRTGVTLVGVEVADAVDMTAAASGAATGAAAVTAPVDPEVPGSDDPSSEAAAATAATGTPVSAPPVAGMIAIPLTTTVDGSVDAVRAFLGELQTGLQRQVLVTTLGVSALEPSTGENGTRPAATGDIEAVVGAFAYVLPVTTADGAGTTAADGAAATTGTEPAGALPVAPGRSPFVPTTSGPAVGQDPNSPDAATAAVESVTTAIEARLAEATAAAAAAATAQAAQAQAQAAAAAAAAAAAVPSTTTATEVGADG
jgi:hypothetical protein